MRTDYYKILPEGIAFKCPSCLKFGHYWTNNELCKILTYKSSRCNVIYETATFYKHGCNRAIPIHKYTGNLLLDLDNTFKAFNSNLTDLIIDKCDTIVFK
jgi:hypothetical protein